MFSKNKKVLLIAVALLLTCKAFTQELQSYPPHWWPGMKEKKLQLMWHGKNIGLARNIRIEDKTVLLKKVNKAESPNYLFLDLEITPAAKAGKVRISFEQGHQKKYFDFALQPRRTGKGKSYARGADSRDLLYLILPDRFSNGDTSNDRMAGMRDQSLRRDTVYNRHGGDLQGIQNHLGYLKDLGVTAIWLNPVLENDMPDRTEHGYAITNHYRVDARLGGNDAYRKLVNAAHEQDIKVIQDAIYNHVGLFHFTVQDPPMKSWLHQWDNYTNTNYKDQAIFDPYGSQKDNLQMTDGWFTPQMPDLNQGNPFMEKFLIQHAIWCVEEFGIDGWRIDTYPYNSLSFMNKCNRALLEEYPSLSIFGETWVHGVPNQSYFCRNNLSLPFNSNLPGVTDFQCLWGITDALTKDFGWTDGVNKLYTTLAQDFLYAEPMNNVVFLDNHDKDRFFSVVNEDMVKYKSALSWLLTVRGVPQVYYGDELATAGKTTPNDGYVRLDFPGGWPGDPVNKFTKEGRDARDREIFDHFRTLANFRKTSSAITKGKMMQFIPVDGLYVYFRYDDQQTVMVAMNTSKTEKKIRFSDYEERTKGFKIYTDILRKQSDALTELNIRPYQTLVLELKK